MAIWTNTCSAFPASAKSLQLLMQIYKKMPAFW